MRSPIGRNAIGLVIMCLAFSSANAGFSEMWDKLTGRLPSKVRNCLDENKRAVNDIKYQEKQLLSMNNSIHAQIEDIQFSSSSSLLGMFRDKYKPCKSVQSHFKEKLDVTDFKNFTGFAFREVRSLGSTRSPDFERGISAEIIRSIDSKISDPTLAEKLTLGISDVVDDAFGYWKKDVIQYIQNKQENKKPKQNRENENVQLLSDQTTGIYSTVDSGLIKDCSTLTTCTAIHYTFGFEYDCIGKKTTVTSAGSVFVINVISENNEKTKKLSDTEEIYFLMKAQSRILKETAGHLAPYYGPIDLKQKNCDRSLKRLIPARKTEAECKKEVLSLSAKSKKEVSTFLAETKAHGRTSRSTALTDRSRRTKTNEQRSTKPFDEVVGSDIAYLSTFTNLIYNHTEHKATQINARDYERAACLFDRVNAQKNQLTVVEHYDNIPFEKFAIGLKSFMVKHFGRNSGKKQCLRYFTDQNGQQQEQQCITKMLVEYKKQFNNALTTLKNDIKVGLKTHNGRDGGQPFRDFNTGLGEYADMYYRVYFDVTDMAKEREDGYDEKCFLCDEFGGCPVYCDQTTVKGPQNMNFAIFLHYAERKINKEAFNKLRKKQGIQIAFRKPEVTSFFDYIQVENVRKLGRNNHEFAKLANVPEVKEEALIVNTINDIEANTLKCSLGDQSGEQCDQGPQCTSVIDTMAKCWPEPKPKHFIFALQTSDSITETDFHHMIKSLETMLHYVLASTKNAVSIFQWGWDQETACEMEMKAKNIHKNCFKNAKGFRRNKARSTDTQGALKFAKTFIIDNEVYDHTVIFITDGRSNTWWWPTNWFNRISNASDKLRSSSTTKIDIKAIGIGMNYKDKNGKHYKELEKIVGSREKNIKEFPTYNTFNQQRLGYQQFICE